MSRALLGRRVLPLVAVVTVLAACAICLAASDKARVYDPRPLMAVLDEKAKGEDFTFAVFGDTYAEKSLADLMSLADAHAADFSITVGDLVSVGGGPRGAADWLQLAGIAGDYMSRRPTWPVPGNHEVRVLETESDARSRARQEARDNYERFYGIPLAPYAFTFGRTKFIVLDWDMEMDVDPPAQVAFLERELADRDKWEHVFVFRHRPFFAIGEKGPEEIPNRATRITRLLAEGRVDAVFSGHEHLYYRARFDGVAYIQAGCGGGLRTLKRVDEALPESSWMGVLDGHYVVHIPGEPDERKPYTGEEGDGPLRFVVLVTVKGKDVTAKVVSVGGETWETFAMDPSGAPIEEPKPAPAEPAPVRKAA